MCIRFVLFLSVVSVFQSLPLSCFSQVYEVHDEVPVQRVDEYTTVYIDDTKSLTIDDVSKPDFQNKFLRTKNLTFGYTKATIWLKLVLKKAQSGSEWYLEIPAPFLQYVDFYQRDTDVAFSHSETGYYRPFSVRAIKHTGLVLPLKLDSKSECIVYIKIAGDSPKTFPAFIVRKEYFHEKVRTEDVAYGIFFGILLVMFFYNLFIYFSLGNVSYLLYIFTIICTFLIFSSATGYAGKYLWPDHPSLNFYAGRLSLPAQGIVLSLFTIHFLELRRYSRTMYLIVATLLPLSVVAAILLVTGILNSAGNNLISVATLVYMTAGIVCAIRGNKIAYYFIAAWTVYLIGGLLLTLRNSGVFDFNFWTTHLVEIGAALETIIIAFALADKYRRLRKEKEDAQNHALKLQLEATEKLEGQVAERTHRLAKAYQDLRETHEKNLRQTKVIEDKNTELDSFFYRVSHDLKGPISSLRGLSQLARMEVNDPVALEYIDKQYQQVERLNQIINGLINLTKLNQSDLDQEPIDFRMLVDDCLQSFHALPKYPQIKFIKQINGDISFTSQWALLNAIVQNLVENAIKYSSPDSPFVKIVVEDAGDSVRIVVEDNGQGIPVVHQPKIFDMFYRATHNATGTGLGLYILKRSLDRLNGTISLTSAEGAGSTFTVMLPKKK